MIELTSDQENIGLEKRQKPLEFYASKLRDYGEGLLLQNITKPKNHPCWPRSPIFSHKTKLGYATFCWFCDHAVFWKYIFVDLQIWFLIKLSLYQWKLQNPNEDTQWNDILRAKGIIPEKEATVTEDQIETMVDQAIVDKTGGQRFAIICHVSGQLPQSPHQDNSPPL